MVSTESSDIVPAAKVLARETWFQRSGIKSI